MKNPGTVKLLHEIKKMIFIDFRQQFFKKCRLSAKSSLLKRLYMSLWPIKSDAKMPAKQNSLLTGGGFIGIINLFSFLYLLFIYEHKEFTLEQDWRICLKIRAAKAA